MKKIIEYKIVIKDLDELEDEVNDYIKVGWQPLNEIIIDFKRGRGLQAMVKYEEEN